MMRDIWNLSIQQPFHCEIEHRLGMNCFTSGPVSCRVRLDRGGYVPGETIGIWASVHNQSRVTIKRTKASLTEVSTFNILKYFFKKHFSKNINKSNKYRAHYLLTRLCGTQNNKTIFYVKSNKNERETKKKKKKIEKSIEVSVGFARSFTAPGHRELPVGQQQHHQHQQPKQHQQHHRRLVLLHSQQRGGGREMKRKTIVLAPVPRRVADKSSPTKRRSCACFVAVVVVVNRCR